jgi:transcriptional/translational regulatory protein YebC/TACO1
VIVVETDGAQSEELALVAIDAGADDVKEEKGYLEIQTTPQNLETVRKAVEKIKPPVSAQVMRVAKKTVVLEEKATIQTLKLLDNLEELDDVQSVCANLDYSEAVLEKLRAQA